jgi:hypothetical protein
LGSLWDYVFRRLFYVYTPRIDGEPFHPPLEIDSVEGTAGLIRNLDLYVDERGIAHVLYLKKRHLHEFLRDKYFPGEPFRQSLEYATIRDGEVLSRQTLCGTPQDGEGFEPVYGRFHAGRHERLYVVAAGDGITSGSEDVFELRCFPVETPDKPTTISLRHPFRTFFTNTVRGGSQPSDDLDFFGIADDVLNLRYAHVRLKVD